MESGDIKGTHCNLTMPWGHCFNQVSWDPIPETRSNKEKQKIFGFAIGG